MADGMSSKFMKNAFVGWTMTAGQYYPPDFDMTKLMPMKHLKPKNSQQMLSIRMMFPFTMVCDECHEYNYTGTKFTSKCEECKGESYLSLKVYRFYGRCRHCWSEFTFKTDPKNSDYTMESGGKRTYEAWKDADMMEAKMKKEREKDAEQDQMKALEQKSIDVQSEMQRVEDLDAIRTLDKRLGPREQGIEEALEFLFKKQASAKEAEEAALNLGSGDLAELAGFREAQEEQKRKQLDDEVEGSTETTPSSSSLASKPGAAFIASALAERAASTAARSSGIGAKFSIKRKEPDPVDTKADDAKSASSESAKRHCAKDPAPSGNGGAAVIPGPLVTVPTTEGSSGGSLGLGAYDSDSSE